jgi:O-acetyl-ADP-ribose deacetylase (regulator of RNase III)
MINNKIIGSVFEQIQDLKLDGIMNAANSIGPMGAGIAGAIRSHGGREIQSDAFLVCQKQNPKEGGAYSTISGSLQELGIKRIIHAVTMNQPGGKTSYDIIENAFKSAIQLAKDEGITRLGCTALGTGVGGLKPSIVGKIMSKIAREEVILNIYFIDFSKEFIDSIET